MLTPLAARPGFAPRLDLCYTALPAQGLKLNLAVGNVKDEDYECH